MYFLVIIQYGTDNSVSQVIYQKESYDAALVPFYTELAYRSDARKATVCIIFDKVGSVVKKDIYNEQAILDNE